MLHIGPFVFGTREGHFREWLTTYSLGFEQGRAWEQAGREFERDRDAGLYDDLLTPCGEHEWCDGEPCMLGEGAPDGPYGDPSADDIHDMSLCYVCAADLTAGEAHDDLCPYGPESAEYATSAERDSALDAYYATEED